MALSNVDTTGAPQENQGTIGFRFVTNGRGEPTLDNDYGGDLTVTKDANVYTVGLNTESPITEFMCCTVSYSESKRVNLAKVLDSVGKSVVLKFDGPLVSASVDASIIYVVTPP